MLAPLYFVNWTLIYFENVLIFSKQSQYFLFSFCSSKKLQALKRNKNENNFDILITLYLIYFQSSIKGRGSLRSPDLKWCPFSGGFWSPEIKGGGSQWRPESRLEVRKYFRYKKITPEAISPLKNLIWEPRNWEGGRRGLQIRVQTFVQ